MGCWFRHSEIVVSSETLIQSPYYGFTFIKCKKCGMRKIDRPYFKGMTRGKWGNEWTDNGGILPQISMKDKDCPTCNRKMEKYTGNGGEYRCHPTPQQMEIMTNEEYHYETIKAVKKNFVEI